MGYYRGGDYYRGGGYYRAGGIFSSIAKGITKVASFIPGPIGAVASIANRVLSSGGSAPATGVTQFTGGMVNTLSGGTPVTLGTAGQGPGRPVPGVRGTVQRALPGGATGYFKSKRMNMGNAKAARRAVRRLKGVRHMLQQIEREMPHKIVHSKAKAGRCGCK